MTDPLISIITVVLNGEKTIERCINSVIQQSYKNIEFIIIDGGSTDNTHKIINDYITNIDIYISEKDDGIYNALNKAIKLCNGKYYLFLGCDDILYPDAIMSSTKYLKDYDLIISRVAVFGNNTIRFIHNFSIGALIKTDLHNKIGLFDESYKIAADTKFLEKAKKTTSYIKTENVAGIFYVGGASSNLKLRFKEHARAMIEADIWTKYYAIIWICYQNIKQFFIYKFFKD